MAHEYENWCESCEADTEHDLVQWESSRDLVCSECGGTNVWDVTPDFFADPDVGRDDYIY